VRAGGQGDHLHLQNVVITPDPPKKGQALTINATGSLDETITAGKVSINIKWGAITVVSKTLDLCTISPQYHCPVPAGPFSVAQSADIPGSAPGGHYTGQVKVTDQSGSEVTCIDLDFRL
jgi:hypothetical protein